MFINEHDATGLAHEVLNAISLAALKFLLECAVRHDDDALCPKSCLIYKAGGDESEFRTCLRAIYALVLLLRSPQRCGSFSSKCFDTSLCLDTHLDGGDYIRGREGRIVQGKRSNQGIRGRGLSVSGAKRHGLVSGVVVSVLFVLVGF